MTGSDEILGLLHRIFGVRLVMMDETVKNDQQELVDDLIAITTSFSARIYGTRGGKKMGTTMRQAMVTLAQGGVPE